MFVPTVIVVPYLSLLVDVGMTPTVQLLFSGENAPRSQPELTCGARQVRLRTRMAVSSHSSAPSRPKTIEPSVSGSGHRRSRFFVGLGVCAR
jgi:hypothetical protein